MAKKKAQPKDDIKDFFIALADYAKEKGISEDVFVSKIKNAIEKSLKTNMHLEDKDSEVVFVNIDLEKEIFDVSVLKEVIEVVDTLYEPEIEIVLEEARKINPAVEVGDKIRVPIDTHEFKRIAAKNAKDLIKQGFRDVERQQLSEMWGAYENEAVSAEVTKIEPKTGHATIEVNHNEVLLMRADQIPGETLHVGDIIKVFITGVSKEYKEGAKKQSLRITRTDKGLIKRLFELECPEIYDGTVEIKSVSRAPGSRSKIAVISNDPNVDAVGACIGTQKSRINAVTKELKGEKVDVVLYSEDPEEFIKQALKPAEVLRVVINDPKVRACKAIVPDNQLSLAIGNKGQNALLAAKLTGFKIDIKAESKVTPEDLEVIEYPPEEEEPELSEDEQNAQTEAAGEPVEAAAEVQQEN
ncbi:MAG: transcription termination/antitermination protein NusA [Oscillospiraceae bacterium]|nr:transcription termination/antitermination protein NusA [Oscillospiraceae bacterium]